jgi:epoxyqueuosine reductase
MSNKVKLTRQIKQLTLDAGFHKVGIAQAKILDHSNYLEEWLFKKCHGAMHWMENYADKRMDIFKLYPEAKSIVSVAHNYYTNHHHVNNPEKGKISRYAWGRDYHKIIKKKLKQVLQQIKKLDSAIDGRLFVDTAPIQDKLWAQEAGIGWQGKNTNILTREMGSWIFLGEIVLNCELESDSPATEFCGSCCACIEACPTKALEPYRLDANKCLSYLTIEYWNQSIPDEYAEKMNNWIFGCDVCQDVCPWNKFAKETDEQSYQPADGNQEPDLKNLAELNEEKFKKRFGKSPVIRAKHQNFIRNVKTVLTSKTKN